METQAVATTQSNLPATSLADLGMSAQDIQVAKLLLMQNVSEAVGDGEAKMGDILNSQTLEVIGGLDKPVEIIPLKMFKTWRVMDMTVKPAKFLREEPMTADNERDPWEFSEGGKERRRDYSLHFFVLLKKEVDEDEAFPCLVSFRRSSANAGKQLATQLFKMRALGREPYTRTAMLAVGKEKFETNTYVTFEIQKGNLTDNKGLAAAQECMSMVDSMRGKVDFSKDSEPVAAAVAPVVVDANAEAPGDLY